MWRIGPLLKICKVPKYYDMDCRFIQSLNKLKHKELLQVSFKCSVTKNILLKTDEKRVSSGRSDLKVQVLQVQVFIPEGGCYVFFQNTSIIDIWQGFEYTSHLQ